MEKILVIENNPLDVRILKDILKDGYEIISSLESEDGISQAIQNKPEIILLDSAMPKVNGKEILFLIKNTYEIKNIPVILTLPQIDPDTEDKWLSYGIADYLIKPFSPGITKTRIRAHIDLHELNKTVEKLMLNDKLTRLPNRISCNERIKSEWARAVREQTPISLAFIDIDHFTSYNEHYGNLRGDDVLRLVASEINYVMSRKTDFIGRYSDEKIIIILPSTTKKGARVVAERARSAVQSLKIPHAYSDAADIVSISIGGITDVPEIGEEFQNFEEIANKMLYEAKAYGRNTIVWYEE